MTPFADFTPAPVSLLYVPGHKPRALEKARGLPADMIIIDLEDAVPAELKAEARDGARAALAAGFPGKRVALRLNGADSAHHAADVALAAELLPDAIVLPKIDAPEELDGIATPATIPLIAMIETPAGVFAARAIMAHPRLIGAIAGLNDLAHALRLPGGDRWAMMHAIQTIVLAARAEGKLCFDGVYNAIDDAAGFAAEAAEGHRLGFDGKSLIHPSQVEPCNAAFAPDAQALAQARALVAAASGGAERYEGRMIEDMHVAAAKALIETDDLRRQRRGEGAAA
jgi:citrate lyase subunit beta/citryl-CoA lyase